jgi:hypothetical protein
MSGPMARGNRIFRLRAARQFFSDLEMPVRQQRDEVEPGVEPEKERGVRFKTRGSRHVSNIT